MTPTPVVDRQVVTWVAGVAAALAIGYVFLGNYLPTFRKKMEKDAIPGLYNNYGNDCFANCVIQSLAGLPSFRKYLRDRVRSDGGEELILSNVLLELLLVLNSPGAKTKSVEPVITALERMYNSVMSRNQQDSQEFLHLITEALSLEDTYLKKQYKESHQTEDSNDPSEELHIPPNPFEGDLSTQIECQRCSFKTPWKKEPFTELSVAVPAQRKCSLIDCLASLITIERIADYACPLCTVQNTLNSLELIPTKPAPLLRATSRLRAIITQIKSAASPVALDIDKVQVPAEMEWKHIKTPATKRTVISKAPQILAVHLVRSVYERGLGAGRNGCEVNFTEDLEIPIGGEEVERKWEEEAVEEDEEGEKFRLMSVVIHSGVHDSGHYICYRRRKREKKVKKDRKGGVKEGLEMSVREIGEGEDVLDEGQVVKLVDSRTKWWEISDEDVSGVDIDGVLRQQRGVYILFFENEKGL